MAIIGQPLTAVEHLGHLSVCKNVNDLLLIVSAINEEAFSEL